MVENLPFLGWENCLHEGIQVTPSSKKNYVLQLHLVFHSHHNEYALHLKPHWVQLLSSHFNTYFGWCTGLYRVVLGRRSLLAQDVNEHAVMLGEPFPSAFSQACFLAFVVRSLLFEIQFILAYIPCKKIWQFTFILEEVNLPLLNSLRWTVHILGNNLWSCRKSWVRTWNRRRAREYRSSFSWWKNFIRS